VGVLQPISKIIFCDSRLYLIQLKSGDKSPCPLNAGHEKTRSRPITPFFSIFLFTHKMTVKLKEFDNRVMAGHKKGCELTDVQRACMATAVACGLSQYNVANAFGVGRTTVRAQVQRVTISPRFKSRIRKRRPKMLSFTARRRLHWLAKRNPRSTWKQLRNSMRVPCHLRTLRRVMHGYFHRKWKAIDRIPLTKEVAKSRLEFARYWLPRLEELHLVDGVEIKRGA
jgi:transposase